MDLKTGSPCLFLLMFSITEVLLTGCGRKEMNEHFITSKEWWFRFKKCINLTAKFNWITKCSNYAQNYIFKISYYFHEICILYFVIFAISTCGSCRWHFVAGSCRSSTLNVYFVLRSCRPCIMKVCSAAGSWGSWILRILDLKFLFNRGILEILDLEVLVFKWDSGDPGS